MLAIDKNLIDIVSAKRALHATDIAARATSFWNAKPMSARLLVQPGSTAEVARILRECNAERQSIVTQGGVTNCVVGVEPSKDDVVLSTEKMHSVIDIDAIGGTVTVEAGAILQHVQETVAAEGLCLPLDLGARGSCTIGGNVATNAGGINVLRYGMTRNLVLGLETVLADGTTISSMNRMLKNNAGYDTKQLFIGSEGTLGIVTRAVLRLFPKPASKNTALVAMTKFSNVSRLLSRLQQEMAGTLSAYEVMWRDHYFEVTKPGCLRAPLARDYPYYVIFETEGSDPVADASRFQRVLEQALEDKIIVDAVLPKSSAEVADIWETRENFEAITGQGNYFLYDVSLPIGDMDEYVSAVKQKIAARLANAGVYTLGHVADGNLHFFVVPGEDGDHHQTVNECVYDPLLPFNGSVSAEHGIGTEKLQWLPHSRSAADIELMRTLKVTLDPHNILNPGRVVLAEGPEA